MKRTNLLKVLLVFSSLLTYVSCDGSNSTSSTQVNENTLVMQDKVVTYDGKAHSIEVENLPEGASVKYTNNDKVEPGKYTVKAKVTFADGTSKTVSAKLIIEKQC